MRKLLLLCFLGLVSHAAAEDGYVIQVGAFKALPTDLPSALAEFGEAVSATTEAGIVRVGVGYFPTVTAAQDTLQRLQTTGYSSAFVRSHEGFARQPVSGNHKVGVLNKATQAGFDANSIVDTLTVEERAKMVLLDGQLHIKEGERFIPLSQYRR